MEARILMFVVAGASGNTGSAVAETLLARGEKIRVYARDAQKVEALARGGAEVAIGDIGDADALTRALRGAEGAYLLLPPDVTAVDQRTEFARKSEALFRAVEAAEIPHVVLLSSFGAQLESGTGPILTVHDLEKRFAGATAAVTFLRPGSFLENYAATFPALAGGSLPTFFATGHRVPTIAARDIGTFAAEALLRRPARGSREVLELSGAEDVSPNDVAAALSRLLGRTITAQQGPVEAMVDVLGQQGLSPSVARGIQEMTASINAGKIVFEGGKAKHLRATSTLEEALKPLLPPG